MERNSKKDEMSAISKRYIPDDELENPPARLFRALLNKLKMNPYKWTKYLRDYLEWTVTEPDPKKARIDVLTKSGNIKDAFFHKPKLTADKLFEGLSITQFSEYELILRVKNDKGEVYEVTDKGSIKHPKNSAKDEASDSEEN